MAGSSVEINNKTNNKNKKKKKKMNKSKNKNTSQDCSSALTSHVTLSQAETTNADPPQSEANSSRPTGLRRHGRSGAGNRLLITNVVNYDNAREVLVQVAFSTLRSVYPSLQQEDIVSAKLIVLSEGEGTAYANTDTHNTDVLNGNKRSQIIVTMVNSEMANNILKAKHKKTSLCTDDLDLSALDQEIVPHVIRTRVFITGFISKQRYQLFARLKVRAKELGFRYVWRDDGGTFLVRWAQGERYFIFNSDQDLLSIVDTHYKGQYTPTTGNNAGRNRQI